MLRGLLLITVILAASLPALAQRAQRFGRSADTWCGENSNQDRAVHCEVRDATIPGANPIFRQTAQLNKADPTFHQPPGDKTLSGIRSLLGMS